MFRVLGDFPYLSGSGGLGSVLSATDGVLREEVPSELSRVVNWEVSLLAM